MMSKERSDGFWQVSRLEDLVAIAHVENLACRLSILDRSLAPMTEACDRHCSND